MHFDFSAESHFHGHFHMFSILIVAIIMAGDQRIYKTLPIDLLKWAGGSAVFMICSKV